MIFYKLCKIITFGIFLISTVTCNDDDLANDLRKETEDDCVCVLKHLCSDVFTIRNPFNPCGHWTQICCRQPKGDLEKPMVKKCGVQPEPMINVRLNILQTHQVSDSIRYPWTLALYEKKNKKLNFLCGASLLGPRIAVTVIHNIPKRKDSSLVIRAGEYSLEDDDEIIGQQDRVVNRIVTHPQYNKIDRSYDIALLFWDEALDMDNENVNTICLPSKNEVFDNLNCVVTGWGTTMDSPLAEFTDVMKYVEIEIIEKTDCENRLNNFLGRNDMRVHKTHLCAGGEILKDTCKGDGGSGLVCQQIGDSNYKLVGLVVKGIGCGNPVPAIYTNIPYLVDWINNEIAKFD